MGTCVSKASSPLRMLSSLTPIIKIAWCLWERPSSEDFTNTLLEKTLDSLLHQWGNWGLGRVAFLTLSRQPAIPWACLQHFELSRWGSGSQWMSVHLHGLFTWLNRNKHHSHLKDNIFSSTWLLQSSFPGRQIWAALSSQHNWIIQQLCPQQQLDHFGQAMWLLFGSGIPAVAGGRWAWLNMWYTC